MNLLKRIFQNKFSNHLDPFLLRLLEKKGLGITREEWGEAFEQSRQPLLEAMLEIKIVYPEELSSFGPDFELPNVEVECVSRDKYLLKISALLIKGNAKDWTDSNEAFIKEITNRARHCIFVSELARAKGKSNLAMKQGDKEWIV